MAAQGSATLIREGHLWILALALLPAAGAPFLALPAFRTYSLPCRVILAAAVGAVLLSVSMTFLGLAGWQWHVWNLAGTVAVLLAAMVFLAGSGAPRAVPSGRPAEIRPLLRFASRAILLVAVAAAFVSAATSAATSADLVLHWGTKAQEFAAAKTYDVTFLKNPFLAYINVAYPPLVPNIYALATMVAGRLSWGAATLTFPLIVLAMSLALPSAAEADPRPGRTLPAAALLAAILASAGPILQVAGNGDMALLFFEVIALALLISPARYEPPVQLLAGVLLAGAATSKVEGLVFMGSAVALFLLVHRRRVPWIRTALRTAGPAVLALGLWFLYGAHHRLFSFYQGFGPLLEIHWERIGLVLAAMAQSVFRIDFAIPFALPLVILLVVPPRSAAGWIPTAVGAGTALFLVFNYLHGGADPTEWIGWTASRVLLALPALFLLSSMSRQLDASPGSPPAG